MNMSNYLTTHNTEDDYSKYKNSSEFIKPNCALIKNGLTIHYNSEFPIYIYTEPILGEPSHGGTIANKMLYFDFTPDINLYDIYINRIEYVNEYFSTVPEKVLKSKSCYLNNCIATDININNNNNRDYIEIGFSYDLPNPDGYTISWAHGFYLYVTPDGHITGEVELMKNKS